MRVCVYVIMYANCTNQYSLRFSSQFMCTVYMYSTLHGVCIRSNALQPVYILTRKLPIRKPLVGNTATW